MIVILQVSPEEGTRSYDEGEKGVLVGEEEIHIHLNQAARPVLLDLLARLLHPHLSHTQERDLGNFKLI